MRSLLSFSIPHNISNTMEAAHDRHPCCNRVEVGIIRLTKRGGIGSERGDSENADDNSLSFHNLDANRPWFYMLEFKIQRVVNLCSQILPEIILFLCPDIKSLQISGRGLQFFGSKVNVVGLGSGEKGTLIDSSRLPSKKKRGRTFKLRQDPLKGRGHYLGKSICSVKATHHVLNIYSMWATREFTHLQTCCTVWDNSTICT